MIDLQRIQAWLRAVLPPNRRASGQGLVEYALILVLVSTAAVIVLTSTGTSYVDIYNRILGGLPWVAD